MLRKKEVKEKVRLEIDGEIDSNHHALEVHIRGAEEGGEGKKEGQRGSGEKSGMKKGEKNLYIRWKR